MTGSTSRSSGVCRTGPWFRINMRNIRSMPEEGSRLRRFPLMNEGVSPLHPVSALCGNDMRSRTAPPPFYTGAAGKARSRRKEPDCPKHGTVFSGRRPPESSLFLFFRFFCFLSLFSEVSPEIPPRGAAVSAAYPRTVPGFSVFRGFSAKMPATQQNRNQIRCLTLKNSGILLSC